MRRFVSIGVAICLFVAASVQPVESQNRPAYVPPAGTQSTELLQGTQIKLVLLHGLSTSVAKTGDPFSAVVAEPVYVGGQLILPAGARVHGEVGNIIRPKRFAIFRGQSAMNLHFRVIQVEQVEVPVAMSILSIHETTGQGKVEGKERKDIKTTEGVMIEAKRDIKRDVVTTTLSAGGGTVIGAVFSHVLRGFTFGVIGGAAYIVAKKGKEVELPAQTGVLVRTDNTVTLPALPSAAVAAHTAQP